MFRKIGFGAAAALTVGLLAVGCSEDGDTIITGGSLTTDAFPGSQVAENNVADDGRAFSNQGQDVLHQDTGTRPVQAQIYHNVSNGEAIGILVTEAVDTNGAIQKIMYASWFDNTRWHTPVVIRGRDANDQDDQEADVKDVVVCFVNTQGVSDPNAAARNGDAVIAFIRSDVDDDPQSGSVTATEEDANDRAWFTYFDRSEANAPRNGSVIGGFNTEAMAIDTDNTFTGASDPGVLSLAIVSDGLAGSHSFDERTSVFTPFTAVDSGQPTSFLSIVFAKDNGSGNTATGTRLFEVAIDGTVAGNTLADLAGTPQVLTPGTGTFTNGDEVGTFVSVHNDLLFWNYTIVTTQNDVVGTVTRFDESGSVAEAVYGDAISSTNLGIDSVSVPAAADIFGGDHGLASTYFLFNQSGFSTDNTLDDGEASVDTDLMVGKVDNDATLSVERAKIDSFDDTVVESADPTRGLQSSNNDSHSTDISRWSARMNRTGEFIVVLYEQINTDQDTDSDGDEPAANLVLYVTAIQTRVLSATGTTPDRDLDASIYDNSASVANFQGIPVPMQTASGDYTGTADDRADLGMFDFQLDLVTGVAESQQDEDEGNHLSIDRNCAIQSNAYRMNFIYTQLDDPSTTNGDINRLLVNGVILTPDASSTPAAPDVDLVDTNEEIVDTQDSGWDSGEFGAVAVDAGDMSRDTQGLPTGNSGRVLVFYSLDSANSPDADAGDTAGVFFERRLFVWDEGAVELVSTDGPVDHDQLGQLLEVMTVPGMGTGTHFGAERTDVIWTESVDRTNAMRLVTRSYDKRAINDGVTGNDSLENRFTPNLVGGTAPDNPVQIDLLSNGPLLDTQFGGFGDEFRAARDGLTVGVFFTEDRHLQYSDTSTGALGWDYENGVPSPQLVDNDSPNGLPILGADIYLRPVCDNLQKSQAWFLRDDPSQVGGGANNSAIRNYVRIHN